MKNNKLSKLDLFKINLIRWILGLVLAFPIIFFLDYFIGRILYYPGMSDMQSAHTQLLRLTLIVLALFNLIIPAIINAVEIFYTDLTQIGDKRKSERLYFNFSFNLAGFEQPIPHTLATILIVAGEAFIISLMIYLKENYYNALYDSMDFLIGAPYPTIIIASLFLVIDCVLIFCILLFLFFWGYSWVQWVSDKIFPEFSDTKYYSRTLLGASLIFRAINMLGLTFVIYFMATFSAKFNTVVKIIFGITILLFLWFGIYIVPYLRERVAFRKNRIVAQ